MHGEDTSKPDIVDLSADGFWLVIDGERLHVPFASFPWFVDVPLAQLRAVQRPSPEHLYWPELDVDLCVASLINPSHFPLVTS